MESFTLRAFHASGTDLSPLWLVSVIGTATPSTSVSLMHVTHNETGDSPPPRSAVTCVMSLFISGGAGIGTQAIWLQNSCL